MAGAHHRGVDRTVAILEAVARVRDGLTLSELSHRLDAPVSSVQQLVNGLVAVGYVVQDARRYVLGPGAFALTMGADWSSIAPVSHERLEKLADELGCSVVLGHLVGDHLMYFDEVGNDPAIDYYAKTRSRRPILLSAGGKRLLAGLPDDELHQRLRALSADHEPVEIDSFLEELPTIRSTGLAYGRALPGIVAVAAGIPGRRGRLTGALVASGTLGELEPRLDVLGPALLDRARQFAASTT